MEVCCESLESVREAIAGGASSIELCSSLGVGGLTPSSALISLAADLVRQTADVELHVLIRPRAADFLYSDDEFRLMLADAVEAVNLGASGIVTGILLEDGSADVQRMRGVVETVRARSQHTKVTFHRAIDVSSDMLSGVRAAVEMGCDRILTSGGAPSCSQGIETLARMVTLAAELGESNKRGLCILPGGGITVETVKEVLDGTGARCFHSSARVPVPTAMQFRRDISMGSAPTNEFETLRASRETVAKMLQSARG
jgi:copper homeostasis protein